MPQPLPNFGAPTMGGYSAHNIVTIQSAATTNATLVVARAGVISQIALGNHDATHAFVKLYNKASAPTVGTDTPLTTLLIPAKGMLIIPFRFGLDFSVGIGFGLSVNPAIADTTAVAANQIVGFITYV